MSGRGRRQPICSIFNLKLAAWERYMKLETIDLQPRYDGRLTIQRSVETVLRQIDNAATPRI